MVISLTAENWKEHVLDTEETVVVEFWHEKCDPCKKFTPVFKKTAQEFKGTKFGQINVLESQANFEMARKYGIQATPTVKFFCSGRPVGELVGYHPKKRFKKEIEHVLQKNRIQSCINQSTRLKDIELLLE